MSSWWSKYPPPPEPVKRLKHNGGEKINVSDFKGAAHQLGLRWLVSLSLSMPSKLSAVTAFVSAEAPASVHHPERDDKEDMKSLDCSVYNEHDGSIHGLLHNVELHMQQPNYASNYAKVS
jgi:hypothetical protein